MHAPEIFIRVKKLFRFFNTTAKKMKFKICYSLSLSLRESESKNSCRDDVILIFERCNRERGLFCIDTAGVFIYMG